MNPTTGNADLIVRFYSAFAARDGEAMAARYSPDTRFADPVFPRLRGEQVGAMWRMLTSRAMDLEVDLLDHSADGDAGTAHWIARYTFTQTRRPVVNDVSASFRFADGLISEHRDVFGFYRWARQALGPAGLLLGWTPALRAKVRRRAAPGLEALQASRPGV